ncbi:uncharacterized protein [Mytilus edulis]|uniref:uncharacterized protein n=1 Tax=Mytilus edulis TaxID=6550 RepID=UPI0039EFB63A
MEKMLKEIAENAVPSLGLDQSVEKASEYFKDLLYIGGWDCKLQKRKSEILLYEYLINESRESMPQKRYIGGSFVEGSEMEGSDHDNMFIYPHVMVTTKLHFTYPLDKVVFLMCQGSRACYTELRFIQDTQIYQNEHQLNPLQCLAEKDDRHIYLLSRKYAEAQLTRLKSKVSLPKENMKFIRNGPCASYESGELMSDNVFTLECDDWPPIAAEWKTRSRKFEWPDENLRNAVINTKCSLVPIGNPASEDNVRKFEWRISFLLGERQLMWSLNQSQYFCFILLKKLKKHFIDPGHNDMISSLILKTTLFWEMEETRFNTWNEKTIVEKVKSCLNRLRVYVEKKTIPHYFAKENNLFTGKFAENKNQIELLKTIDSLSQNLLVHLYMDSTSIMPPCGDNKSIRLECKWRQDIVFCRNYFYCNIENALHCCTLSDLKRFEHGLDGQMEQCILDVHKHKARELLSLKLATTLYTTYGNNKEESKLNEIEERYKEALNVDAICGRLHLATFYLRQHRLKEVLTVINSIYEKEVLLYDGGSSTSRVLQFKEDLQIDENRDIDIAHDISFFHSDMCAPDIIHAELCVSNESIIRIHPFVYMYLLEFLVSTELSNNRREALEKLSCEVLKSRGGHDTDIAFNICGYCNLVFGDRKNALFFFLRSFRIRPSVQNVCLFYVGIMLFELIRR